MFRAHRIAFAALVLACGISGPGQAQAPANPPAEPPHTHSDSPAGPPSSVETDKLPAPSSDPFGEEVQFAAKTVVRMKGNANWDTAFETLIDSFKSIGDYIARTGLKRAGPALTVYLSTDDTGFQYEAGIPIEAAPADAPRGDIEVGTTPSGKMLKFVHRGSYDSMDTTYEAITNFLDSKQLEAQDTFIEEYVTDPVTTPEDKLVVNVYVPVK
ncbi:MAG TPA: GyrI-like domain-containing protein [Xanthobacteraceae bacterium]|nr:GyrI-like domain-containing protein [Xanthobacteraceae bacterium]